MFKKLAIYTIVLSSSIIMAAVVFAETHPNFSRLIAREMARGSLPYVITTTSTSKEDAYKFEKLLFDTAGVEKPFMDCYSEEVYQNGREVGMALKQKKAGKKSSMDVMNFFRDMVDNCLHKLHKDGVLKELPNLERRKPY